MTKTSIATKLILLPALMALSGSALAQDWKLYATPSATVGSYQGSLLRNRYSEYGVVISGEYKDQGGLTLGLSNNAISQKNGAPDLKQQNTALSGRWSYALGDKSGSIAGRMDIYRINANDAAGNAANVNVLAPQVSWLSHDNSLYADLGYARSRYVNNLTVIQLTPTVGFGFNQGYDWLQFRAYSISGLSPALTAGKSSTSALEASWTHYFGSSSAYMPASLTFGLMGGERIYTVNRDALSVANVADLQTGAANVSATWALSKTSKLMLLLGQNRFRNLALVNDYKLNVVYAGITFGF